MYTRKQIHKTQFELSKGEENRAFDRANDVRRDDDTVKQLSIGLYDIDYAIKYYFDEVIKPEIEEFGNVVKVPVMYGSPEKWKNVQADGYFRDKSGKIQSPLIAYKRTSITRNKTLGNKIDANFPSLYYSQELKYNQINKYDQFSVLTNSKPIKTFINTVVPDYVDITYDVVVWTDYIEGMNKILESIIYTEGTYWGDMEKFKFRTKIDSITNTTDLLQDADRMVRSSFTITLFGQIVPDVLAKELSKKQSEKSFDVRQIVLEVTPDADPGVFQQKEDMVTGGQTTFTTPTVRTSRNKSTNISPSSDINQKIIINIHLINLHKFYQPFIFIIKTLKMPKTITINNVTGITPYDVYLCGDPVQFNDTNCYYIGTTSTLPYSFTIPDCLQNVSSYNLKVVSFNKCINYTKLE